MGVMKKATKRLLKGLVKAPFKADEEDDAVVEVNDDEEPDEEDDDEEEFEATPTEAAITIFVIITILIFFTIIFEEAKDLLLEYASKYTKPVIMQLFSEMTVLGFLSILTFVFCYGGTLDTWSADIFGESGEDYIEDMLETIHYLLFLIMVLTITEVFLLIYIGNLAVKNFYRYNVIAQDPDEILKYLKELDDVPKVTYASWCYDYVYNPWTAWRKHEKRLEVEETVIFYALRREFLLCRSPMPPYQPAAEDKQLPSNFDYSLYLNNCLSIFLIKIVNFTTYTWLALWSLVILFFCLELAVEGEYVYLAGVWLFFGYLDMTAIYLVQLKCFNILENLINPDHLRYQDAFPETKKEEPKEEPKPEPPPPPAEDTPLVPKQSGMLGEMKGLVGRDKKPEEKRNKPDAQSEGRYQTYKGGPYAGDAYQGAVDSPSNDDEDDSLLPAARGPTSEKDGEHTSYVLRARAKPHDKPLWTQQEQVEASWVSRQFYGNQIPNRQLSLFWYDNLGPELNIYILRVHLILQSIYLSLVMVFFVPYMFTDEDYGGIWQGMLYLILAIIPFFIQFFGFYPTLIVQMAHVASTGILRNPTVIDEVIRAQKAGKIVKLLMMLTKLKGSAGIDDGHGHGGHGGHGDEHGHGGHGHGGHDDHEKGHKKETKKRWNPEDPVAKAQINEISTLFDKYDADGSGNIDREELRSLLVSFGMNLTPEQSQEMLLVLDKDGDGQISKEELIEWQMNNLYITDEEKEEEMKHMAHKIFSIFDTDGHGEITVPQFTEALMRFNAGLTTDEIIGVVRDFDEDGDGTISLEEFEKAIEAAMRS